MSSLELCVHKLNPLAQRSPSKNRKSDASTGIAGGVFPCTPRRILCGKFHRRGPTSWGWSTHHPGCNRFQEGFFCICIPVRNSNPLLHHAVLHSYTHFYRPIHWLGTALGGVAIVLAFFTNDISKMMNNKLNVDLTENEKSHLTNLIHHHDCGEDLDGAHDPEKISKVV